MNKYEAATNLAAFLVEKAGSVLATWEGKMTAKDQRKLFGANIGKGTIVINGEQETICNRVSVCFGLDYDERNVTRWSAL